MPVNHSKKIVFIHIPKTAGGSIEKALGIYGTNNSGSNFIDHEIGYGFISINYKNRHIYRAETKSNSWLSHLKSIRNLLKNDADKLIPLQHQTLVQLDQHFNLKNYYKFSVVRNPFSRLISAYKWLNYNIDINHFINNDLRGLAKKNYYFFPQKSFLVNSQNKIEIDAICKFESLQTDVQKVFDLFKVSQKLQVIHSNRGNKNTFNLDESSIKIIKEVYAEDFEEFDYPVNYQSNSGAFK